MCVALSTSGFIFVLKHHAPSYPLAVQACVMSGYVDFGGSTAAVAEHCHSSKGSVLINWEESRAILD